VNGNLALSRAIGDFEFKQNKLLNQQQQIVTAFPDVLARTLTDQDEFIVLACDGIWDCMSNQEVVTFIRRGIAGRLSLGNICERLMERCLAEDSDLGGVGCDNMTVVIVGLLNGRTKAEWYEWVGQGIRPLEGTGGVLGTLDTVEKTEPMVVLGAQQEADTTVLQTEPKAI
jgi:protein phosphatase 2C family protein 2/3